MREFQHPFGRRCSSSFMTVTSASEMFSGTTDAVGGTDGVHLSLSGVRFTLHYTFLRSAPRAAPPFLRLYHSAWSAQRALLACAWSDDAAVVQSFLSRCRQRPQDFSARPDPQLDSLLEGEECAPLEAPRSGSRPPRSVRGDDGGSEVSARLRVKRGFIVPGTLWCGSGNKAPSYADLGVFSDTDSCCREHDQCQHTILSFQSEFGVFNSNIFTMSHCDCDNRFHSCLKEANDSISDVVGYTFFNLLKMHCFTFSHRLQCAKRNWFGMCKESQMALYADVHPPTLYETTPPEDCSNVSCSNISSTVGTEQKTSTSTLYQPNSRQWSSSMLTSQVLLAPSVTVHRPLKDSERFLSCLSERQTDCSIFRELDDCKMRILPQQAKYGLVNTKAGTLYHCNCTASSCPAVELKAELQPDQQGGSEDGQQRHLQAVNLKVRRPKTSRAARKDRRVRLFKLCVRKTQPRQARKGRRAELKTQQPE
uniref:phospholipase A2 n=1 Tax=Oryzias melastigma TaxID=30732 RepID=A0A3B3CUW6_ORYME